MKWYEDKDNFPVICWVSNNTTNPKEKKKIRLITRYEPTWLKYPVFISDETYTDKEGWQFAKQLTKNELLIYGGNQ